MKLGRSLRIPRITLLEFLGIAHLKPGAVGVRAPMVVLERPDPPATRVVLTAASRELRRQLSPTVWAVL